MLRSLLYVSRSTLSLPDDRGQVEHIVRLSRRFNAGVGITGALVFTEICFAQFLEGPEEHVDALLKRIRRDARHADVDVIIDRAATHRLFPGWSMAYCGPHVFLAREFAAFAAGADPVARRKGAEHLIEMMAALSMADKRTCN